MIKKVFDIISQFRVSFFLTLLFCVFSSAFYTYYYHHSWYSTKIGISPFYEVTEEVGGYLKEIDSEDGHSPLPFSIPGRVLTVEYKRIKTFQSRRRPLRHEMNVWHSDSASHLAIIKAFQNYVDTLVVFPNKSFEERKILAAEIMVLDSLLKQPSYKDSIRLILKRRAKAKELENNYKVNYVFAPNAKPVTSFEYGKFLSFWIIPLLIWWSWVRYKENSKGS